jgi:hypothetical protein
MKAFWNSLFSLFFVLIIVGRAFAFPIEKPADTDLPFAETATQEETPVIQGPNDNFLYATEVNNSAQVIAEKHRLDSWQLLPNRLVPRDFDFRECKSFPIPTIYSLQVPIFIMNRALLN